MAQVPPTRRDAIGLGLAGLGAAPDTRIIDPRPVIRCARQGCRSVTLRDVRLADQLPAPADAGWYEVEIPGTTGRTVLFACCQRCATVVASVAGVARDLSAFSEHSVLPE